jgi:hypothetical protein
VAVGLRPADSIVAHLEGEDTLVGSSPHGGPRGLGVLDDVGERLGDTASFWRSCAARRRYDGPWREAVVRSALALELLVHAPSESASTMSPLQFV